MAWNSKDHIYPQVTHDEDYYGYYKYIITNFNYSLGGSTRNQKVYVGTDNLVCYTSTETISKSDYIRCYFEYWSSSGMYTYQNFISFGNETSKPYNKYIAAAYYDSTGSSSTYPSRNVYNNGVFYVRYTSESKKTEVDNMLTAYGCTFTSEELDEISYTLRINGVETDEYEGSKIKYLHYNGNDYKIKEKRTGVSTYYFILSGDATFSSWRYNNGDWIPDTSSVNKWYTGGYPIDFNLAKSQAKILYDVTELSTNGSGNWDGADITIYDGEGNIIYTENSPSGQKDWTSYLREGGLIVWYGNF